MSQDCSLYTCVERSGYCTHDCECSCHEEDAPEWFYKSMDMEIDAIIASLEKDLSNEEKK